MNVYDSDRMASVLKKTGYDLAVDIRDADVVLINTCSIREKAENRVLTMLGQLKPLKAKKPGLVIGVAGCVGQRMGRKLLQKVAHLDLVLGPDGIDKIADLVTQVERDGLRVVDTVLDSDGGRHYSQPLVVQKARPTEYMTVMKGCDHFCTYCIVPYVRGREKSRSISEIIGDVERLVAAGTREITFLGQNINTYGKGTGESLAELLERANEIHGLQRIRFLTSHPRDMDDDLISKFGRIEKLMPQLHLPFQAGSDAILKRMARLYTRGEYLEKVRALRQACPDLSLSTDVIVGFPGETEEDFAQSLSLLGEVGFGFAYLFKYSRRPGTRAYAYEKSEEIPDAVKDERLARAISLSNDFIQKQNESMVGNITPVLIESIDKKQRYYFGRNPHNKLVHVLNAGQACVGKVVGVEITQATNNNLKGYYVGAPKVDRVFETALSASLG